LRFLFFSASDPDEAKSASAKSASDPSPKKEAKQVAAAPKPDEPSVTTRGQKKQKSKRTVVKMPLAPPKPRETNGGVWDEDLDRLHGTWRMVDVEYESERNPNQAKEYSWVF